MSEGTNVRLPVNVRVFWSFNTPETNTNKESVFGIKTLTSVLL